MSGQWKPFTPSCRRKTLSPPTPRACHPPLPKPPGKVKPIVVKTASERDRRWIEKEIK